MTLDLDYPDLNLLYYQVEDDEPLTVEPELQPFNYKDLKC